MAYMIAKREKIKESQLVGFKYFKAIAGMLERLHDAGCARDRAGNRLLHMDQYVFDPLVHVQSDLQFSAGGAAGQRASKGAAEAGLSPRLAGQFVGVGPGF